MNSVKLLNSRLDTDGESVCEIENIVKVITLIVVQRYREENRGG